MVPSASENNDRNFVPSAALKVPPFRLSLLRMFQMYWWRILICFGLWLFSTFATAQVPARVVPATDPFREDRILVKRREAVPPKALRAMHGASGTRVLHAGGSSRIEILGLPKGTNVKDAIRRYQQHNEVEYAEPDYRVQAALTSPNDSRYRDGTQWGLNNLGQGGGVPDADINAPEAWDTLNGTTNVIVAILDSGMRYTHLDLKANLWTNPRDGGHGFNALTGSNDPRDDYGHGTMLAGIIGGHGNNGFGVAGVAWRVQMMACKFLDASGNGSISDAIVCIDYAKTNGAKIINASWGTLQFSQALRDALADAAQAGIVVAAAAGNFAGDNDLVPFYPASYELDNVVSVAALTRSDTLWTASNFGARSVDLAAPGVGIYSTAFTGDDEFGSANGTSLATAYVSGALALLAARFPDKPPAQQVTALLAAATPVSALAGRCVTGGRLNLANALGPSVVADFTCTPREGAAPLEVQFTDRSFGVIINRLWDFGDGNRATNVANPSHRFAQEGEFAATLTVTGAQGLTSRATNFIRAIANYQLMPVEFHWVGAHDARLQLGDNAVSGAIPLPFPFWFYGRRYDAVHVGANGIMGFAPEGLDRANAALPSEQPPNAMLAPFWTDLNPAAGGKIFIGTKGKSPQRVFCVTWQAVPIAGHRTGPNRPSFQVVLFEENECILFQYLHTGQPSRHAPSRHAPTGPSVTIGIENETGRVGAGDLFPGGTPVGNKQAILFVPTSQVGVTQKELETSD